MSTLHRPLMLATLIVGASLSFIAEPLIGRLVVPRFGGAVHVWTVCMMVFQALLMLGYAWAHLVAPRIGPWHLVVMALAAAQLPLGVEAAVDPQAPLSALVRTLLLNIALPFWALTTTSVVVQDWFARAHHSEGHNPYVLYSASNIGSLVGLVAYPFVVEPLIGLSVQRTIWTAGYALWLGLLAATWFALRPAPPAPIAPADGPAPSARAQLGWLLVAAAPSALLLAVTQTIASEVGSFPMVWVIPLALYLASFILAFREAPQPWAREHWPDLALATVAIGALSNQPALLIVLFVTFFGTCVAAHNALFQARPAAAWLTRFYLVVAAGGWLGGLVMSVGAPQLLDRMVDLQVSTAFLLFAMVFVLGRPARAWWDAAPAWRAGLRLGLLFTAALWGFGSKWFIADEGIVDRERNFYGVFEVRETALPDGTPYRLISHGRTIHGIQYLDPKRPWPLSYYHEGGPLHQAFSLRERPARVAMVGLGAGAMAAWSEPGEVMVFYEIDAENEALARRWFSFLDQSPGAVEVRVGDARLVMQAEADRAPYDLILVDAFAGDAIPMHLMTVEAQQSWLSRLAPNGLLVVHLSNRYYDLRGVLDAAGRALGLSSAWAAGRADPAVLDDPLAAPMLAMALARDPARLQPLVDQGWTRTAPNETRAWTDDWQNPLGPLWLGLHGVGQ